MQRLLMIDDDARLAAMVRDYLAASGYRVDWRATSRAALPTCGHVLLTCSSST